MDVKAFLEFVRDYGRKPWAPVVICFFVLGAELAVFKAFEAGLPLWTLWVAAVSVLATTGAWLWFTRCPKHTAGNVGFSIAISCDDEDQRKRLLADFVGKLEELFLCEPDGRRFQLIVHDQHRAKLIKDHSAATALMTKARADILIFGSARLREINGKPVHVLKFEGVVKHAPAPSNVSREFGKEFREVLPKEFRIDQNNDFFAFEAAAVHFGAVAKYIIGTAALISGDFALARDEFESLLQFAINRAVDDPAFEPSASRLKLRLADVHRNRARILGELYRLKRDKALLEPLEQELVCLERYDTTWYSGPLQRAICGFVLRRDIRLCWEMVERCRGIPDTTWRYTEAFLHAYTGDLGKAQKVYAEIFVSPSEDKTVPIQCEEFIDQIIQEEPNRFQLYYCLGLINWQAKEDVTAAKRDFEKFLSLGTPNQYVRERKQVEKWLTGNLVADLWKRAKPRRFKF